MRQDDSRLPRPHFGLRGQNGAPPPVFGKGSPAEVARRNGENSKRTMMLTVGAFGAGMVGLYYFANSGGPTPDTPRIYANVADCVAARIQPAGSCEQQWNVANQVHQQGAPAYPTRAACEQIHGAGKCAHPATPDDEARASKFIPVMSGYFFGRTAQGTFKGVPLYVVLSDGAGRYRIAEIPAKEAETEPARTASSDPGGGVNRNLLVAPAAAAIGAASALATSGRVAPPAPVAPAMPPAAASAMTPAAAPAMTPAAAPAAAPARTGPQAQTPSPRAATTASVEKKNPRGGFGATARGKGRSGGG